MARKKHCLDAMQSSLPTLESRIIGGVGIMGGGRAGLDGVEKIVYKCVQKIL